MGKVYCIQRVSVKARIVPWNQDKNLKAVTTRLGKERFSDVQLFVVKQNDQIS